MTYKTKISVKLHIPLFTESKLFCSCKNSGGSPNANICNTCMGKFGTTPYLNKSALLLAVLTGASFHCLIGNKIVFDKAVCPVWCMPKGYRIVQQTAPVAKNGYIDILSESTHKRVKIKACRLEEGYRIHEYGVRGERDFNNCGTAILTVESGYDLRGGEEVKSYLNGIYSLMHYIGASPYNYNQPDIPMEVRIAVGEQAESFGGTSLLMKASPDEAEYAVDFEIGRQMGIIDSGQNIKYEKITFDKKAKCTVPTSGEHYNFNFENTVPMRDVSASSAEIQDVYLMAVSSVIGELPYEKKLRYIKNYGINEKFAEIISSEKSFAELFEYTAENCKNPGECAYWIADELMEILKIAKVPPRALDIKKEKFAALINLFTGRLLDVNGCREILTKIIIDDIEPFTYAAKHGLLLVTDEETIKIACKLALKKNTDLLREYLTGNAEAFKELCSLAVRELCGRVSPDKTAEVMKKQATCEFLRDCDSGKLPREILENETAFDISSSVKAETLLEYVDSIPEEDPDLLIKRSRTLSNYQIGLLVDNIVKRSEKEAAQEEGLGSSAEVNPNFIDARPYFPVHSSMTDYFLYMQPRFPEYDDYYDSQKTENKKNN